MSTSVADDEDWTNGYLIPDKFRELFDKIVPRWCMTPLPTYDSSGKFIKINDLEVYLRESLVLVHFELRHYAIRDKRTNGIITNTFSATATQVKILQRGLGAGQTHSPYKSLMLKGPKTFPQSPSKRMDQINVVKAYHPGKFFSLLYAQLSAQNICSCPYQPL